MRIEDKTIVLNYLADLRVLLHKGRYTLAKEVLEKAIKKLEE